MPWDEYRYLSILMLRNPNGFTLLEVLVALAIMSVSAMALLMSARNEVASVGILEERTLGALVASNQLAQWQVQGRAPDSGSQDQDVNLGGRAWTVRSTFTATPAPSVRRVDVAVGLHSAFLDKFQPMMSVTGYIHLLPGGGGQVAAP